MYSTEKMWTSSDTTVTTRISATARPSMWLPMLKSMPPDCHHVHDSTTGATTAWASSSARGITAWPTLWMRPRAPSPCPASSTRCTHWRAVPTDRTKEAPTAAMASSAPLKGRRLPKNRMRKNAAAGIIGISQALLRNQPPAVVTSSVTFLGLLSEHEAASTQPFIVLRSSSAMLRRLR